MVHVSRFLVPLAITTLGIRTADAQAGPSLVFIAPQADADDRAQAVLAAVRSTVGDVTVRLDVETMPQEASTARAQIDQAAALARRHGALASLWIDLSPGDDLLYVVDPTASRVEVRRIQYDHAARGAETEAIAVITRATARALVEGQGLGDRGMVSSPPAPRGAAPTPVEPTPPGSDTDRWRLGLFYRGRTFASSLPWQSGAGVVASWSPQSLWLLGVGAGFFAPGDLETPAATLRIFRVPFEVFAGVQGRAGPLRLGAELDAVAEYGMRSTLQVAPGLAAAADATRWALALGARMRATWPASAATSALLRIGVEAPLTSEHFVIGSNVSVADAASVRALVDLGVVWSL